MFTDFKGIKWNNCKITHTTNGRCKCWIRVHLRPTRVKFAITRRAPMVRFEQREVSVHRRLSNQVKRAWASTLHAESKFKIIKGFTNGAQKDLFQLKLSGTPCTPCTMRVKSKVGSNPVRKRLRFQRQSQRNSQLEQGWIVLYGFLKDLALAPSKLGRRYGDDTWKRGLVARGIIPAKSSLSYIILWATWTPLASSQQGGSKGWPSWSE